MRIFLAVEITPSSNRVTSQLEPRARAKLLTISNPESPHRGHIRSQQCHKRGADPILCGKLYQDGPYFCLLRVHCFSTMRGAQGLNYPLMPEQFNCTTSPLTSPEPRVHRSWRKLLGTLFVRHSADHKAWVVSSSFIPFVKNQSLERCRLVGPGEQQSLFVSGTLEIGPSTSISRDAPVQRQTAASLRLSRTQASLSKLLSLICIFPYLENLAIERCSKEFPPFIFLLNTSSVVFPGTKEA